MWGVVFFPEDKTAYIPSGTPYDVRCSVIVSGRTQTRVFASASFTPERVCASGCNQGGAAD